MPEVSTDGGVPSSWVLFPSTGNLHETAFRCVSSTFLDERSTPDRRRLTSRNSIPQMTLTDQIGVQIVCSCRAIRLLIK